MRPLPTIPTFFHTCGLLKLLQRSLNLCPPSHQALNAYPRLRAPSHPRTISVHTCNVTVRASQSMSTVPKFSYGSAHAWNRAMSLPGLLLEVFPAPCSLSLQVHKNRQQQRYARHSPSDQSSPSLRIRQRKPRNYRSVHGRLPPILPKAYLIVLTIRACTQGLKPSSVF